jgi:preprotein translocase subunit Sec63
MANVTKENFKKSENDKEDVVDEGEKRVKYGIAESFTVEDDGEFWVLVTVLKQIS